MAKVSLNKLSLKVNQDIKTIDFNGQNIEIKQYLPINEKLELISNVITQALDEYSYANPVKIKVYTTIELFKYYTNINFTEKQLEDIPKLYDLLTSSGASAFILNQIPQSEVEEIVTSTRESIESISAYQSSILGVLETLKNDYSNLNLDIDAVLARIKDPQAVQLLQELAPIIGTN
jgi:hypothetical protein